MKLLYCKNCGDIIRLSRSGQHCECGACIGFYRNDLEATIIGPGVPLGIGNESLRKGIEAFNAGDIPAEHGYTVDAFVISREASTITVKDT